MKKLLSTLALLAGLALVGPAPAAADFSLSIGLPGFGLFVHDPYPPQAFYPPPPAFYPAPPVYYRPPVAYYRQAPRFFPGHRYRHGHRYGWNRHGRDCDD